MICQNKTALTDNELNQTFGNGIVTGVLPSSPNPVSDRNENGMLKDTVVQNIITSLKGLGVIPNVNSNNLEASVKKQAEFLKNIQDEYCFYESRYKFSLQQLFTTINQGYLTNTADIQTSTQQYLQNTQMLNKRLNDLTQIINAITEDMLASTNNLEREIIEFNNEIKKQGSKLHEQNKIISSNQATTDLKKQMVKFTEGKARYTNNLLGLYSFLNIVALGLLVYIYKAASV